MAGFPGQVESNIVGSTFQAQTPEQAAMERMKLQRMWQLEDVGRERNQWWQRQRDTQALADEARARQLGEARQAFNQYYRPRAQNEWNMMQGQVIGPQRPAGIPAAWGAYNTPGGGTKWAPNRPMPEDWYQNAAQSQFQNSYNHMLLQNLFGPDTKFEALKGGAGTGRGR